MKSVSLRSRVESPGTPASADFFDVKTIIGALFKMMGQIFLNHFLREFSGGNAEISSRREMATPVLLFYHWEFHENLSRNSPFGFPHDVNWIDIGWSRNQDVDMIFADNVTQNLDRELFTCLPNKYRDPSGQGLPGVHDSDIWLPKRNGIVLLPWRAIIHAADYKPTASRMLPA